MTRQVSPAQSPPQFVVVETGEGVGDGVQVGADS